MARTSMTPPGAVHGRPTVRRDLLSKLEAHGIASLDDLARRRRREVLAIPGIGRKRLRDLEIRLRNAGKQFLDEEEAQQRNRHRLVLSGDEVFVLLHLFLPQLHTTWGRDRHEIAVELGLLPELLDSLVAAVEAKVHEWQQRRRAKGWPA